MYPEKKGKTVSVTELKIWYNGHMERKKGQTLYEWVAEGIIFHISQGSYTEGDKLPSIRTLSKELKVSINTVKEAYNLLEDRQYIEGRSQSGYYVRSFELPEAGCDKKDTPAPQPVTLSGIYKRVMEDILNPKYLPLGIVLPSPDVLPLKKLMKLYKSDSLYNDFSPFTYAPAQGFELLRKEIAKRYSLLGLDISFEDIIITNGCMEGVFSALSVLCKPGDAVAVESPIYFNFYMMLNELGLKVIEVPSHPVEGINLGVLEYILENNDLSACLFNVNFNNPTGSLLPENKKKDLVELLARFRVPLIEDDIYGDVDYSLSRPGVCKAFDRGDNNLLCSSFSKTIAPGFRVGWIIPGKYKEDILRFKIMSTIATPSPTQIILREFLAGGGYDRYLRGLQRKLRDQSAAIRQKVLESFPAGTRVSNPRGGIALWIELPGKTDSLEVYYKAVAQGITIAPGKLFSLKGKYDHFIRLNTGFWDVEIEKGIEIVGGLV